MKQQKIKIIFDATPMVANKTGIAYYTERLVTNMARLYPDEVELVGFYYNFLGRRNTSHMPRAKNLRYMGASLIPSKIVFQLRRWGIELPIELLALGHSDFVLYTNFLGYPSLFKTPSAPVIHDLTFLDLPDYVSPKLRRDLERFVPKAIKRSAFVVTVSEFSKRGIHAHYAVPEADILVTPIPPVPPHILPNTKIEGLLAATGITKPFILFVGTIEPRKNITGLIEAYKLLPEKSRKEYSLVLAGRVERFAQAEASAIQAARDEGYDIIHLGYVDDDTKDALFQSATVFAHASQYEGFGMPILEAMRYGRPCAISNIPVFREVGGEAVLYFDHTRPTDAARTIQKLLYSEKLRADYGRQAVVRAESFKWEDVARKLLAMIHGHTRG